MTFEEIQQGLAETPELKNQLLTHLNGDVLDHVKGQGYVVRSQDEEKNFLTGYENEKIKPRIAEIYDNIDKDVFETSGIARDASKHPRTYDYVKGVLSELKTKGVTDEATKQLVAQLQGKVGELESALSGKDGEIAKERMAMKIGSGFDNAFAGLKIALPQGIDETESENYAAQKRNMMRNQLLSEYEPVEQDGKIIYKGKDGNYAMNGANYASEKDLLTKAFKYDFEQVQQKRGTGTGSTGTDEILASVTDKQGIYDAANKKGLIMGSTEWKEFVTAAAKDKNIAL